jgi:outer membrane lipoprotein-sorting protein
MSSLKSSRAIRWAVPVGAIAVVGAALGAGPVIAAARGNPSLPPKTAAELLAAVTQMQKAQHPQPLSGTVVENASLGLPALPGGRSGTSPVSLLSGSHTARVWYGDQQHVRLALLDTGSETDFIRNGADTWQWSSAQNTATHRRLTEKQKQQQKQQPEPKPSGTPLTPQQAADKALAAVGKTTTVRVDPTGRVAGRDAYELVLSPKDGRSLVGQVRLALDGKTYVPLRVQVYARGASSPAAQIGFTSVTFTKPAAANFSFKPPSGAKVVQQKSGGETPAQAAQKKHKRAAATPSAGQKTIGSGWTAVEQLSLPQNAQNAQGAQGAKGKDTSGMMAALQRAATPVHGSWGSGRVLRTKLFSALLTDDGRLYVGAVTPDVLTQAAAHR